MRKIIDTEKDIFTLDEEMTKFEDIMMRKVVLFMIVFASAFSARAQQDAMFSHYMFNTQSINPGYVGSRLSLIHI